MSRNRSSVMFLGFAAMATAACPLAAGCMMSEADEMLADDGSDVAVAALALTTDPPDPPAGSNPFYPECFWHHRVQQTYRDLAGGPLANAQGQLPSMQYIGGVHPTCRMQSLSYLIKCALPEGTSVTDPANGATYYGHYGVAPEWRTHQLSNSNKEWMTSCIMQHLNGYQTTTNLLLEGNKPGFYINTVTTGYPKFDTISWGNLWDPVNPALTPTSYNANTSSPAFRAKVCFFGPLENACVDTGVEETLDKKTCGNLGNACGMTIAGRCETVCTWNSLYGFYTPTSYWTCDGKTNSFREKLPDYDMYYPDCEPLQ